jgi:WD40 repeat protein
MPSVSGTLGGTVAAVPALSVPGYQILEELGRGGQSIVYKACQRALDRLVALKVIQTRAGAVAEEKARFRREAEAVAHLVHPHIVQIHDVGEQAGQPYFALEYVSGGTLAKKLAGMPLPAREAARVVETLARTIHCAHQRGIVHRDLKPSNVLVTADGTLKISDFGLAKRLTADATLTQTGLLMGTPSYMAPEQATGKNKEVGPATDVYGLGAMLYEMLTGRPPFLGATVLDILPQVIEAEPVPPRRLQPNVQTDLETICLKCLEKDPTRRYASAELLADDLTRYLAGEPIHARRIRPWQRLAKWARRKPAIAGLTTLVLLVTLAGLAGVFWQWQQAETHRQTAEDRAESEARASRALAAALRTARRTLYFHQVGLADRHWWNDDLHAARRLLKGAPIELRHFEWHLVDWRCRSALLTIPKPSHSVAFSSQRQLLATSWEGKVYLWNLAGKQVRILHWPRDPVREVYRLAFSPDGKYLAAGGDKHTDLVPVWRVDSGKVVHRLSGHSHRVHRVAFRPDGRQLACSGGPEYAGEIVLWNLATGERQHTLKGFGRSVDHIAYSPDGKRLAGAAWDVDAQMRIWDPHTGKQLRVFPRHLVHDLAFSPDSRILATASVNRATIQLWDVDTGLVVTSLPETKEPVHALAFDNNLRLAGAGADGVIRIWNWRTGELLRILRGHEGWVGQVVFSSDGLRLASIGSVLHLWNLDADQETRLVARHTDHLALHPNGARLATATHGNHTVSIWDISEDRLLRTLPGSRAAVTSLAFSPGSPVLGTAYADGSIVLTNIGTGKPIHKLHHRQPRALAFSGDGLSLATVGISPNSRADVHLYSLRTGELHKQWTTSMTAITYVSFHREGDQLFVGGRESQESVVNLFACDTGKVLKRWSPGKGQRPSRWACDPSGQLLAAGGLEHGVVLMPIWDGAKKTQVKTRTRALAFSPDGLRLATADQYIRLWDTKSGNETLTLRIPERFFPKYFFTEQEKRNVGIFFTEVQMTEQAIAGRTCEGSVWLWTGQTPPSRQLRTTRVFFQDVPVGASAREALAAYGIRLGKYERDMENVSLKNQVNTVLPLGADRAFARSPFSANRALTSTRTFRFAKPLRGFALTRVGVINGASLARWRLEAFDVQGNILATTGEMEYGKDPLPRTFGVRADGISSVRLFCDNNSANKRAYASYTTVPIAEILLEH